MIIKIKIKVIKLIQRTDFSPMSMNILNGNFNIKQYLIHPLKFITIIF